MSLFLENTPQRASKGHHVYSLLLSGSEEKKLPNVCGETGREKERERERERQGGVKDKDKVIKCQQLEDLDKVHKSSLYYFCNVL